MYRLKYKAFMHDNGNGLVVRLIFGYIIKTKLEGVIMPNKVLRKTEEVSFNDRVDEKNITEYLYDLEETYSFLKKQSKLSAHFFAYFLTICLLILSQVAFRDYIPQINININIIFGLIFLILGYGIYLIIKGINLYRKSDGVMENIQKDINHLKRIIKTYKKINQ